MEKVRQRALPSVIKKPIPCAAARAAHATPLVFVDILRRKLMAVFAMSLCPLHFRMFGDSFFLRFRIVVMRLLGKYFFCRPSVLNSVKKRFHRDAMLFFKLGNVIRNAINFNAALASGVARLLAFCRPPAIPRLIVSVRIWMAVNCHSIGALSHIFVECIKRVAPSVAHLYSSPAVILKAGRAGTLAARNHCTPCSVVGVARAPSVATPDNFSHHFLRLKDASINRIFWRCNLGL